VKSFFAVGYANFRPNDFAVGKRISKEIFAGVGMMCKKIFIVFVTLSDLNKT